MNTQHTLTDATNLDSLQARAVMNGIRRGLILTGPLYDPQPVCGHPQCINWEHWQEAPHKAPAGSTVAERIAAIGNNTVTRRPELGPCHEWRGGTQSYGYPSLNVDGKARLVSRLVLSAKLGRDLTADEVARHRCDNPLCIRGEHLIPGTHQDNMADAVARGRMRNRRPSAVKPGTAREIVALYHGFGQNSYEIARATGLDASTVRRYVRQLAATRREHLDKAA